MKLKSSLKLRSIACAALFYPAMTMAAPNPVTEDWVFFHLRKLFGEVQNFVQQAIITNAPIAGPGITIQNKTISTVSALDFISVAGSSQSCNVNTVSVNCPDSTVPGGQMPVLFNTITAVSTGPGAPTYNPTTGKVTINASGTYRINYNINGALCDAQNNDTVQFTSAVRFNPFPSPLTKPVGVSATIIAVPNHSTFNSTGGVENAGSQVIVNLTSGTTVELETGLSAYEVTGATDTFWFDPAKSDCGRGSLGTMMSIERIS